ncbi:MAG: KH domain-containing protein [Acidobacteria bacterium]|nr:MAG: KH domain-containing protein [Acidobacteriota bacterium]RPJ75368.1 MAG: KH domain-containing protein [Acidobacteriota bacterium]
MSHAREVIEVVARALVDDPDAVRATETAHRGTMVIELFVAPEDLGRIIGRQGRTATALRTLVAATADHHGQQATLEIREPDEA